MSTLRLLFDGKRLKADQALCHETIKNIVDRPLTSKQSFIDLMREIAKAQKLGVTGAYYSRHYDTEIRIINGQIVKLI